MSKTKPEELAAPVQKVESSFRLRLDEFCAQLSKEDKRVSLIGGFHAAEKAAGRLADSVEAYKARYSAFINKPA